MGALTALFSLPDIQSSVPEDNIYGIGGLLEPAARTAVEYGKDVISTSNIIRDFALTQLRTNETTFPPHFHMAGWGYKDLASPISSLDKWTDKTPRFLEQSVFTFPDPPNPDILLRTLRVLMTEARNLTNDSSHLLGTNSPYASVKEAFMRTLFGDVIAGSLPPLDRPMLAQLMSDLELLFRNPSDQIPPHGILFELGPSLSHHRFCVTREGHFGLVPRGCQSGDEVFILWGAQTPFVLRKAMEGERVVGRLNGADGKKEQRVIMGSCYLHGFMLEEATKAGYPDEDVIVR